MLDKYNPNLKYQLAGREMSPWMPRGSVGKLISVLGEPGALAAAHFGGFASLPATAVAAPVLATMTSPRLNALTRYGVGATLRGFGKMGVTQDNLARALEAGRVYQQTKKQQP